MHRLQNIPRNSREARGDLSLLFIYTHREGKILSESCISFLFISELCIETIVGVYPLERQQKQRVLVDLTLEVDFERAAQTDELANALDYALLRETTIEFVQAHPCQLLETLAMRLRDHLFSKFPSVKRVELQINKPDVFADVRGIGVVLKSRRRE